MAIGIVVDGAEIPVAFGPGRLQCERPLVERDRIRRCGRQRALRPPADATYRSQPSSAMASPRQRQETVRKRHTRGPDASHAHHSVQENAGEDSEVPAGASCSSSSGARARFRTGTAARTGSAVRRCPSLSRPLPRSLSLPTVVTRPKLLLLMSPSGCPTSGVEQVEELGTELEPLAARQREGAENRQVHVPVAWATELVAAGVAEARPLRLAERRRVEVGPPARCRRSSCTRRSGSPFARFPGMFELVRRSPVIVNGIPDTAL